MKKHPLSSRFWIYSLPLVCALSAVALSCGKEDRPEPQKLAQEVVTTELDRACASPIFGMGRRLGYGELESFEDMKLALETVHFRDVIWRSPNDVELAYQVDLNMRLNPEQFLVPEHAVNCIEENRPSKRAERLSRTMIPVPGDLHLPSARITVFDEASADRDRLYNYPRISEVTFSSKGYFSFNQNWAPYSKMQSLGHYLNHLQYRALYDRVEVREMGYGRIGIFAEKNVEGERAQLLVVMKK